MHCSASPLPLRDVIAQARRHHVDQFQRMPDTYRLARATPWTVLVECLKPHIPFALYHEIFDQDLDEQAESLLARAAAAVNAFSVGLGPLHPHIEKWDAEGRGCEVLNAICQQVPAAAEELGFRVSGEAAHSDEGTPEPDPPPTPTPPDPLKEFRSKAPPRTQKLFDVLLNHPGEHSHPRVEQWYVGNSHQQFQKSSFTDLVWSLEKALYQCTRNSYSLKRSRGSKGRDPKVELIGERPHSEDKS